MGEIGEAVSYLLNNYARENISFKYGKNSVLFDERGKDYIDFSSGIGVNCLGYANERLSKVISNQAKKLIHTSNLYHIKPQEKLARKLSELSKFDMAAFFANSGAEANEAAIKIARKYGQINFKTKKYKILTLKSSFHGRTITTLKATGQESFHKDEFAPYPKGFDFCEIDSLIKQIDDKCVAVMIELIQGEGGVKALEAKKVQKLAEILKEKKLLLIVDEVQSGIYRSGEFLASNLYKIKPDIITLAKALSGGVPIGAVLTKHKDIFSPGDHGSTFGGNFLSTTAGLEVLKITTKLKTSGKLDKTIELFDAYLSNLQAEFSDIFLAKTGLGLMRGLECKDGETLSKIVSKSLKNGVILLKSGNNTLRFLPPLVIKNKEMKEGFLRLKRALNEI